MSRKQHIHNMKIRNAKPTLKRNCPMNMTASLPFIEYDEPVTISSLYHLLKSYSLQQYTRKLRDMGFADDLSLLATQTDAQISEIYDAIKLLPGHRAKFNNVILHLRSLMCRGDVSDREVFT